MTHFLKNTIANLSLLWSRDMADLYTTMREMNKEISKLRTEVDALKKIDSKLDNIELMIKMLTSNPVTQGNLLIPIIEKIEKEEAIIPKKIRSMDLIQDKEYIPDVEFKGNISSNKSKTNVKSSNSITDALEKLNELNK